MIYNKKYAFYANLLLFNDGGRGAVKVIVRVICGHTLANRNTRGVRHKVELR